MTSRKHTARWVCVWVCVWDPADLEPKVFLGGTLPFGATASVAAFLRASKALRELGIQAFSLVRGDEDSTDVAVRFLFKSLGWWMSESPEKESHSQTSSLLSSASGAQRTEYSLLETPKRGVER